METYLMILVYGEMVNFNESDKIISGKVSILNTYNGFNSNISFFIRVRTSSD